MTQIPSALSIEEHASFSNLNYFNIKGAARYLIHIDNEETLLKTIHFAKQNRIPMIILGSGSNVLLLNNIEALMIHIAIMGITMLNETDEYVYLKIGAGVNWHEFVEYCLAHHYYGIENLSLIPGTVGAAPIQNIGAYGVEIKDVFHELQAFDRESLQMVTFDFDHCQFSYRNSLFKKIKDRYIVTSVTLRLNKIPRVVLTDKSVCAELTHLQLSTPTPHQLSEIICNIRRRKLPYDRNIGNAGSFFMNPFTREEIFFKIKNDYPDAIGFSVGEGLIKVAAGWMIDKCGWKGYRDGDAGVYEHNALVLVNYGNASGEEILRLAEKIQRSVKDRFAISLEMEPRVYC